MKIGGICSEAFANRDFKEKILGEIEGKSILSNIEIEMYGPEGDIKNILATFYNPHCIIKCNQAKNKNAS